jgi:hypothetical protein
MGKLYDYKMIIEDKVKDKGPEGSKLKGKIGLKVGILVSMISPTTPDDPEQMKAMQVAIKEVLGIAV